MHFFTLSAMAVLFMLAMVNTAPAEHVTKSTDSGDNGEMRQVIETATPGATVTFAPSVHPVLTSGAINVTADGMSIKGNLLTTIITRTSTSAEPVLSMSGGSGKSLTLENLTFQNIARQVGNVETYGGGVVSSVNSLNAQGAALGNITNSFFDNNRITLGNYLHGGGLVGAYSNSGPTSIGDINAVFSNNRIVLTNTTDNVAGRLWGAGLIGAYATEQPATIGNITGLFINNSINATTYINGAGLVGSFVDSLPIPPLGVCTATIGNVHADFINNHIVAGTNLSGAGLVGGWSWTGDVIAGDISGTFKDNIVTANSSYMRGGGIVGLRSYLGETVLGKVSASFLNNQITVGTFLGGGGILGLYSADTLYEPPATGDRDNDKTSTLAGIDGANFIGNIVRVGSAGVQNVYALSGVVAVSGLNEELIVNNTIFQNNKLYLTGQSVRDVGGGAFYIGTDRGSANPDGHVLTLTASNGMSTEFRGNSLQITEGNNVTSRYNAITFGREWDRDRGIQLNSRADAQLNISPQAGGKVLLLDPVKVDMNNSKNFTMNINGPGYFLWGGRNEFFADASTLTFANGITELAPDFQVMGKSAPGFFQIAIEQAHTLRRVFT